MLSSYRTSTITFPDISPNAFQHPSDKIALNSLQSVPMIDTVQKWLMKNTSERSWNLHVLANSIRLGPSQGADIYNAFEHAASVLDIKELPSIYLMNNPQPNAFASGVDEFAITLTSGLVDALSEDELLGVIGHELGHIKCEHMLYKSLARNLSLIGINLLERYIPGIGSLALSPIKHALLYWSRMAEFSCDRAALLVTQDVAVVQRMTIMLAAGTKKILNNLSVEAVLVQAEEYKDEDMSLWDKHLIFEQESKLTHPVPVLRVKEITAWADSQEYASILAGDYIRKSTELTLAEEPAATETESTGGFMGSVTSFFTNLTKGGEDSEEAQKPDGAPPPIPPEKEPTVWHYFGGDEQLQLTAKEIAARYRKDPAARHLVWKEGMTDWEEASSQEEIQQFLRADS